MKALAAAVPNVDNAAVKAIPRTYSVHNSIPPPPTNDDYNRITVYNTSCKYKKKMKG